MSRVFVLGLDGFCLPVWEYLKQNNLTPHLEQILKTTVPLISTIPPHSAPAWTSIATGLNPGRHGILDFWERPVIGTSHIRLPHTSSNKLNFWEIAHQQNLKVGVFNYPLSYPPREVNGFWVSGLNNPPSAKDFAFPSTLNSILSDFIPDIDIFNDLQKQKHITQRQRLSSLKSITTLLINHIEIGTKLLLTDEGKNVDLHIFILTCTDRLLHLFWDLVSDEALSPSSELLNAFNEYWKILDNGVDTWVNIAKPDFVLTTSDHGFTNYPKYAFNFNKWLVECNILRRPTKISRRAKIAGLLARNPAIKTLIKQRTPQSILFTQKNILNAEIGDLHNDYFKVHSEIIYGSTLGLSIYATHQNRHDIVTDILSKLKDKSSTLKSDNGESIISSLQLADEIWWGEYKDTFPNIVITLSPQYGSAVDSVDPRLLIPTQALRNGDHSPIGMVAFSEYYAHSSPPDLLVWDIPAIALHLSGASIPKYFDGEVPPWIPGIPKYTNDIQSPNLIPKTYTEEEAQAITERLRGLGYME